MMLILGKEDKTSPSFQVGVRGMNKKTRLILVRSKKNERCMSRNRNVVKKDLMAKARICLEIVFTSLKAGSDFKKRKLAKR